MANRAAQLDAETKQRHPQATVKRRGRNFIEHDLGGGVTRWTGTIEPLHTQAGAAIDTAWVSDVSPWSYRVSAADYTSRIKAAFNGAPLLQYTDVATGAWVTLQPQQLNWTNDSNSVQMISAVQGVTAELADDLVRWAGAYGAGRDFEYVNHPKRFIKRLVLQSALPTPSASILSGANPALQLQFIFAWSTDTTVWIDGAQWGGKVALTTTQRIEFRASGVPVFWFDAPVAYDASGENYATGVVMRVRKAGKNLYVEVRTPYAWLQGAQYPVVVDPTLTDGYGGNVTTAKDVALLSGSAEVQQYNLGAITGIPIGFHDNQTYKYRSLVEFGLSSIAADATCNTATLTLTNTASAGQTSAATLTVYAVASGNHGWVEGNGTWGNAAAGECCYAGRVSDGSGGITTAWAGSAGLGTSGTDYAATAIGTHSIGDDAAGTAYDVTLTASAVEAWFGSDDDNHGILLRDLVETTYGRYASFASSDHATTGYRPILVVDYTATAAGNPWYAYAQM